MQNIINNTIKNLNRNSTLDEIKTELKAECEKASFSIETKDWNYMFDEIIYRLAQ